MDDVTLRSGSGPALPRTAAMPLAQALALAVGHHQAGRFGHAEAIYRSVLAARPGHAHALDLLGVLCHQTGRSTEAVDLLERAVATQDRADYHANLGLALHGAGRCDDAERALEQALAREPEHADARLNLGNLLREQGRLREALAHYDRALAARPEHAATLLAAGLALQRLGDWEGARVCLERAAALAPGDARLRTHLARLATLQRRHGDAHAHATAALALAPGSPALRLAALETARAVCDWRDEPAELDALFAHAPAATTVFFTLALPLSHARRDALARHPSERAAAVASRLAPLPPRPPRATAGSARLRVGYVCDDLRDHPVGHLTQDLFAAHDRAAVEVFVYSTSRDDGSPYRARAAAGAEHFVELVGRSPRELAARIRDDGVDVAVDLQGHTHGHALVAFALRPAPVQATYLAYPGPLGAGFVDYALTDRIVTPRGLDAHYREKLVRLPGCYQVNASRGRVAPPELAPDRAGCGLPSGPGVVVLACFNASFKLDPRSFACWMRVLARAPRAVLWLLVEDPVAQANVRREAVARGIDPARLVFARRCPRGEHLARHRHVDLFLDTFVYGAHTTASDALSTGVPVLTLPGEAFASRVATSLLTAQGATELIAVDEADYERRAVALVSDPVARAALRTRLLAAREHGPLFDTARTARSLERAYARMWARHAAGLAPAAIDVPDDDEGSATGAELREIR